MLQASFAAPATKEAMSAASFPAPSWLIVWLWRLRASSIWAWASRATMQLRIAMS
jgi:hypothetical protein